MKGTLYDPVRVMKRAMVFASRNAGRPILCAVHLDECGDVVSTDSYRLYVEQGAWSGPSVDIDYGTAYDIAHCKVRGNDTAELEVDGERVEVRMGDGTKIVGGCLEGKYPEYGRLFPADKPKMTAYMRVKQALPIVEAHRKKKSAVRVESACRDLVMCGANGDVEPGYRVEKACDGEDMAVALNAEYLKSALKAVGEYAEVRVWGATKPVVVTWDGNDRKAPTVLLMPVRFEVDAEPKVKEKVGTGTKEERMGKAWNMESCEHFGSVLDGKKVHCKKHGIWTNCLEVGHCTLDKEEQVKETKSEESKMNESINLKGERVCITGTLPGMTRSEAFIRLKAVGGVPCERFTKKVTLFVIAAAAGRDKRKKADKAIADGQELRVVSGHEFVEALKEAEREQTAKAIEQAAKRRGVKMDVKVHPEDGGVQAIEMTPKKEDSMIEEMKARLEKMQAELRDMKANAFMWETQAKENEKELKAARKELDGVWKENAALKAKPEPKQVPPAPKAPKVEDTAAAVSLETMQKWCEGKGLIASQKRPGTCIWVEGDSKAYADELKELGFRFAKKRKSWYLNPAA